MSDFIYDPRPLDPPEYWDEHFFDENGEEQVFTPQERFRVFHMEDDSDF